MRAVIDTAIDAIIVIDERGLIETVNPAGEHMFGYTADEMIGRNVSVLMPAEHAESHDEYIARYLQTGDAAIIGTKREVEARRKDGSTFPVDLAISEARWGKRRFFTGVVRDLTDRKLLDKKLIEQETLARLGHMATIVAHEIKNPLAGIVGALRMLLRRMPDESSESEICEEMIRRVLQLNETVNDILVFARPKTPNLQSIPVLLLLEDVVSLVSKDAQFAHVSVHLDGSDMMAVGDPEMLRPAFLNLLMNAAQAMHGRGSVAIHVERTTDSDQEFCRIAFRDTGPGIPEDVRQRVFEPFFTTKGSGTGLGLAIAKRIVELHGGTLEIECPAAGGTTLVVAIPSVRA